MARLREEVEGIFKKTPFSAKLVMRYIDEELSARDIQKAVEERSAREAQEASEAKQRLAQNPLARAF